MAEPYKRKTRYPGLKEHERLQKQKEADAKKAKKRLKRMKPKLEGENAKRKAEEWQRKFRAAQLAGAPGSVSGKPLLNGETKRIGTTQEQHRAKRLLDPKPSPDVVPEGYPKSAVPIPTGERTHGRWYPGRPSGRFDPNAPAWTKAGGGSGILPRRTKGTIEKVKAFAERRSQGVMRDVERLAPWAAGPIMGPIVKEALRGRAGKKK